LKKARERDFQRWQTAGLPTRKVERWKYTNVSSLAQSPIVLPAADLETLPPRSTFPRLGATEAAAEIVFFNGQYVPNWSRFPEDSGVSVVVLTELFDECVNDGWTKERLERFQTFREHVETSDADRETIFAAMNTSFLQDGVLIYVKPNTVLEKPIVVSYFSDSTAAGEKNLELISPRVFAHLDRGAQAGLVEVYAGRDDHRYFANAVSDIRLEQGARLSYSKVQLEGNEGAHIGTTRVHQKRDSFSECFQFSLGAKLSRQDLHISLEGEGAEAFLDGLYMVRGKQHVDNFTSVEHVVPHTTSEQVYKGILDGESRAVFNGHVHIHKDAQKSLAAQLNNNLLLSLKAEADTKPELEIYADDVKAAHGATIGQIDPEHVFYLQARAIPRAEAVRMLARGFAQDIVFRIRNEKIRSMIRDVVDQRFDSMQLGEISG
jgi:Fe-S cluster assembly protein SufD